MKAPVQQVRALATLLLAGLLLACESAKDPVILIDGSGTSAAALALAEQLNSGGSNGLALALNFEAIEIGRDTVHLAWENNAPGTIDRFKIYMGSSYSTVSTYNWEMASLPADTTEYVMGAVEPSPVDIHHLDGNTRYFFLLSAVDSASRELGREAIDVRTRTLNEDCDEVRPVQIGGFFPPGSPAGLAWDGKHYLGLRQVRMDGWLDNDEYYLEKFNTNGGLVSSTRITGLNTDGFVYAQPAFDGQRLWFDLSSDWNGVYAVDVATAQLVRNLSTTPSDVSAITYDALHDRLVLLRYSAELQAIDPVTGAVERTYENPLGYSFMQPSGMAAIGNEIWVSDRGNTELIVAFDSATGKVTRCMKSPATGFYDHVTALTWKGRDLVVKTSARPYAVYRFWPADEEDEEQD